MTLVGAPSAPIPAVAASRSLAASVLVPLATIVSIVAVALLPLLTPFAMHPLLSAAQADLWLGVTPGVAHGLSDATVHDLVLGGSYAIPGPDGRPLYAPDEVSHMVDARTLLWLLLGAAAVAATGLVLRLAAGIDRAGTWRGIARGGAIAAVGAVVIGVVGFFAFEPLFELFHRVFFPGGNWAFDPDTSRLVRLYPYAFWELAATALGAGVVALGALAWLAGRRPGRAGGGRVRRGPAPGPAGIAARARALLADRRVNVVVRSAGYLAIFAGFLIVLQGSIIVGLWMVFLGWLLTRAARATYNVHRLTALLDGLVANDALVADPPGVAPTLILETLVEEDSRQTGGCGVYPVRQGADVLGIIDVLDADEVARAEWSTTPVRAVMRPLASLTTVAPDEPLLDTVARFEKTRREAFAVMDPADPERLLGLVTRERVHALMRSRAARTGRQRGLVRR